MEVYCQKSEEVFPHWWSRQKRRTRDLGIDLGSTGSLSILHSLQIQ